MVKKESGMPQKVKDNFLKTIKDTTLISRDSMPKGLDEATKTYLNAMSILHCGVNNNAVNAFALWFNDKKYIMLCKGIITATVPPDGSQQQIIESLFFLLGHELGHHLHHADEDHFDKFKECIAGHPSQKHLKHNSNNPIVRLFTDTKIEPHMGEIVADFWGVKMIANRSHNYHLAHALQLMRNSYAFLCGSRDEGIHPNGHYRINFLLRSNKDLMNSMSCIEPTNKAYTKGCPL